MLFQPQLILCFPCLGLVSCKHCEMRTLTNNHIRPGSSQVSLSSQPPESQELVTDILPHTQIQ